MLKQKFVFSLFSNSTVPLTGNCDDGPGIVRQIVSFVTVCVRYIKLSASNFCCCVWHSNRLFTIITLERCGLEWPSSQVFLLRSANICVRFFSSRSCALLFSPLATFYSKNPLIFSKQPPPLASTRPKPANLAQLSRASYSFPSTHSSLTLSLNLLNLPSLPSPSFPPALPPASLLHHPCALHLQGKKKGKKEI